MVATVSKTLLWFRQDLRVQDNHALAAAIELGDPIVPVFIWAPQEDAWSPGGASRWWLSHALQDLQEQLAALGSKLTVRDAVEGGSVAALVELAEETGAETLLFNEVAGRSLQLRDDRVSKDLEGRGLRVVRFQSGSLFGPGELMNKAGNPYQVFTPMWRHLLTLPEPKVVPVDLSALKRPETWPRSRDNWISKLRPTIPWDGGMKTFWGQPTRKQGWDHLKAFARKGAARYSATRDLPAENGTTHLSPYLAWGQVGVREVWVHLRDRSKGASAIESDLLRQLAWREFARHLLHHFPETVDRSLRPEFAFFPWDENETLVCAWQRGETGYPIVDAGMRQLWETGWMHNRVRMIVGSFLVKHLLQHWLEGARWFWDTLVDADLPNNTMGWQWIGGCGADAAPYFRVFNPIAQGEKFDPHGNYVKRYLPELAQVPSKFIHCPWKLGPLDLQTMGVMLGKTYPQPIIEHASGRLRALEAWEKMKARSQAGRL